jgi:predicted transglutaminase-like cysteine proteinase
VTVDEIFHAAKFMFGWADDSSTFGKAEYWATYDELMAKAIAGNVRGDCDDFAEICVLALRKNGHKARFVMCRTETNEMHLVAECEGVILDNRMVFPTPQNKMKYEWISISGYAPGEPWHLIVT